MIGDERWISPYEVLVSKRPRCGRTSGITPQSVVAVKKGPWGQKIFYFASQTAKGGAAMKNKKNRAGPTKGPPG